MMKHAIEIGLRQDDPTRDVRAIRVKSDSRHSWTEDEIAQFEACYPIGSRTRLALALGLYTGQRLSDVIRMGRQHIRDGLLHVKQKKTGVELWIPVAPQLQEIIAASSVDQMTPRDQIRHALQHKRFRLPVPSRMQQGRIASLHLSWAASCGGATTRRCRVHSA
jgi:integrase